MLVCSAFPEGEVKKGLPLFGLSLGLWQSLSVKLDDPKNWQPGDVVIWDIGSKKHLHIGIIGKKKRSDGFPYVIHNMRYIPFIFAGKTIEQDILEGPELLWMSVGKRKIIGHYRIK